MVTAIHNSVATLVGTMIATSHGLAATNHPPAMHQRPLDLGSFTSSPDSTTDQLVGTVN